MLGERERSVADAHTVTSSRSDVGAHVQQFLGAHRIPFDAVEKAQQPWVFGLESGRLLRVPMVPDLRSTADELVAAWTFHAVDAQVGATDPDSVLRRPRPCRVVLGGHETVPWVERNGHGRPEVDVAETEDEVIGVEHDAVDVVDRVESVHAADELDVPGAPRCVGSYAEHVALDRLARRGVVPRQRQVHRATGYHELRCGR